MLNFIIFFIIACILIFIIYIGSKALGRGIDAKTKLKKEKPIVNKKKNISDEIKRLNELKKQKIISEKEFKIAKKKLLY
tara:strand:+ start:4073 stop:4309 length:237 start_codon:yes stop_codon:yes gene_type:complete